MGADGSTASKATWGLGPSLAVTLACREDARPGLGLTFCVGRGGQQKGLAMACHGCHQVPLEPEVSLEPEVLLEPKEPLDPIRATSYYPTPTPQSP